MPCYRPLTGYRSDEGRFKPYPTGSSTDYVEVPCGYCVGCRIDRARDWKVRMYHESQMHDSNAYITLTYDDKYLPRNGTLVLSHFQKFMKRLRKHYGANIRFFHAGEYGGEKGEPIGRPHYHAIIFGVDFEDKELAFKGTKGHDFYRSQMLEKLWPIGFSSIGDVVPATCGYVAKYIFKKKVGDLAKTHYSRLDEETGECIPVNPEYATMSRRPGLGFAWFQKYWRDVYALDAVVMDGKELAVPKYYDYLLEHKDPKLLAEIQEKREQSQNRPNTVQNRTDERLADREQFTMKKLETLSKGHHLS